MNRVDEHAEHECPRPLEEQVADFSVGGVFLSPAKRLALPVEYEPRRAAA
jgi:hypothetical protein